MRATRNRRYQRHPFDDSSHEVMIANYTTRIRTCQEAATACPTEAFSKLMADLYNNKRDKLLNQLARMDRKRYDVMVKDLGIDHQPSVAGVCKYERRFRKKSIRALTDEYCHRIKKSKLEAYHTKLKAEQEPFLQQAAETRKWIEEQMKKYHISEADLTPGIKPRLVFRPPTPVRPMVQD